MEVQSESRTCDIIEGVKKDIEGLSGHKGIKEDIRVVGRIERFEGFGLLDLSRKKI
ncbi:unnamed protein product [Meloidogyne enterolobii]|uniref:Uncharacterized protein n=1 Tax=Meloidogyne enterolobii TaxID=390850 RepID=A0ACB1B3G5_MELEN